MPDHINDVKTTLTYHVAKNEKCVAMKWEKSKCVEYRSEKIALMIQKRRGNY
jgi:hypothetical protein